MRTFRRKSGSGPLSLSFMGNMSTFDDNPLEDWIIVLNSSFLLPWPPVRVGRVSFQAPLDIGLGLVSCFGQFSFSRGDTTEASRVLAWSAWPLALWLSNVRRASTWQPVVPEWETWRRPEPDLPLGAELPCLSHRLVTEIMFIVVSYWNFRVVAETGLRKSFYIIFSMIAFNVLLLLPPLQSFLLRIELCSPKKICFSLDFQYLESDFIWK